MNDVHFYLFLLLRVAFQQRWNFLQ